MFCSNHFSTWLPYSFLSFCLTLLLIFSLTAVKVREWEGRPGFRERLGHGANSRSNTFPFLVLEPPGSASAWAAGLVAMETARPWLPFPRGLCPPFLAGPLPSPLPVPSRLVLVFIQIASPSSLAHSQLCAVSRPLLSPMVHLSPSPHGLPPHHHSSLLFPPCLSLTPLCFLALSAGALRWAEWGFQLSPRVLNLFPKVISFTGLLAWALYS